MKKYDFGLNGGISLIKTAHLFSESEQNLVIASQAGEIKICEVNIVEEKNDIDIIEINTFDLSENGAIWAMDVADVNSDGKDEILIGGMNGGIVCLTGDGKEVWNFDPVVHRCASGVSGVYVWKNCPLLEEKHINGPISVFFSLDRTIRVLDNKGKLLWSQMFASGVGSIAFGDTNGNGTEELIAGGNDGTLRIFDGKNGKLLWFKELNANIRSISCSQESFIFCGGDDRIVHKINGKTQNQEESKPFPTYVWKIQNLTNIDNNHNNNLIITTYSFTYIGMEDPTAGDPSIGSYTQDNLELIWSVDKFNCQDLFTLNNLVLAADSSGKVISIDKVGNMELVEKLPSLINSISYINQNNGKRIILAGCDDKNLYALTR